MTDSDLIFNGDTAAIIKNIRSGDEGLGKRPFVYASGNSSLETVLMTSGVDQHAIAGDVGIGGFWQKPKIFMGARIKVTKDDGSTFENNSMYSINPNDQYRQWSNRYYHNYPSQEIRSAPAVSGPRVYYTICGGSYEEGFLASHRTDVGQNRMGKKYKAETQEMVASPAIINDVLYFCDSDPNASTNNVMAVNISDFSTVWTHSNGSPAYSSPAYYNGSIFVGRDNGWMYSLDATDGTEQWATQADADDGKIRNSPAVVDGEVFYRQNTSVRCLNASDGSQVWSYRETGHGSHFDLFSSVAVAYGKVYYATDYEITALDKADGSFLWEHTTDTTNYTFERSSPTILNDSLYIGTTDGRILSINTNDGTKEWEFNARDYIRATPAPMDGSIIFGDLSGYIYSIDETGSLNWEYKHTDDWEDDTEVIEVNSSQIGEADGWCFTNRPGRWDQNTTPLNPSDRTGIGHTYTP